MTGPAADRRPDPDAPRPPRRPPHAVVIGAGPDGLAAALALARHVERVTLVDAADVPGPGWGAEGGSARRSAAVRQVLESPQVVVRAGLEAVGLVLRGGRVAGVLVRSRRASGAAPDTIEADLVVDARGAAEGTTSGPRPDGLVRIERPGPDAPAAPGQGSRDAWVRAAVLDRVVGEHLARHGRLAGVSAVAQRRLDAGGGPDDVPVAG